MAHKRLYVRVPITGEAILSNKQGVRIKARAKDISQGGMGVTDLSSPLDPAEYQVEIITVEGERINFTATLVHKSTNQTGFETSEIDKKNFHIIADLIAEFQSTEEFIKQIDKSDLLEQSFIDENGDEISVTFDRDLKE